MFSRLFKIRPVERPSDRLYARAVEQARRPEFYTVLGVEDRIDARFELYTLHVLLLVMRLRDEGEGGVDAGQDLFDTYVSSLDNVLRELGVSDVAVSKKMRKLGEALYGRMTAYEAPLADADPAVLADALARNVFESEDSARGEALAAYALDSRRRLSAQSVSTLESGPDWAEVAP